MKQIFIDYTDNICIFTGDLDPNIHQISHFGDNSPQQAEVIFSKLGGSSRGRNHNNIIEYGEKSLKVVIRKILLDTLP